MSVSRFDEALAYNPEFAKLPEELRKSILEHIRMHYSKEHALRKELESHPDVSIKNCAFEGENSDGSKAFEFELLEGGLNKLTKINLDGWLCYGPSVENPIDALQQRLTVAEQRAGDAIELLEVWRTWLGFNRASCDEGGKRIWDRIDAVVALKPAEEQTKSCPNCKVCMGSPDFPENCLINGVKP